MHEKTPQDYANELLQMHQARSLKNDSAPVAAPIFQDGTGGLQVNVTTLNRLYPVKGALVTVFTGPFSAPTVIDVGITDDSGKSDVFVLPTPPRSESQQSENGGEIPYANYNVSVRSDGYVEQLALNVPVFSGVISVQGFDLISIASAGSHTKPQIINETNDYNL